MGRTFRFLIIGLVLGFAAVATAQAPEEKRDSDEAYVLVRGQLIAQEHELAEGYFNFGEVTTLHVKPDTTAWLILRDLNGRAVELIARPQTPRQIQRIDR